MNEIEPNTYTNLRLGSLEKKFDDLEVKVDKILVALTGDEFKLDKGLVAEYKDLRERVSKLETLKNRIIWISIGAGFAGGIGISKLVEIIGK